MHLYNYNTGITYISVVSTTTVSTAVTTATSTGPSTLSGAVVPATRGQYITFKILYFHVAVYLLYSVMRPRYFVTDAQLATSNR